MVLMSSPSVWAVSRTGGASSSSWSGYFQGCDPEECYTFAEPDSATTEWYLLYSDSGTQRIQYFQQDQDLTDGEVLWAMGASTPDPHMYSDFYYSSGSSVGSDTPTGPLCYSASYPSCDFYWSYCDSLAATLYTYSYPPGYVTSYAFLTESDAVGTIGVSPYSGSLY